MTIGPMMTCKTRTERRLTALQDPALAADHPHSEDDEQDGNLLKDYRCHTPYNTTTFCALPSRKALTFSNSMAARRTIASSVR